MKKLVKKSCNFDASSIKVPKQKERHIVSWSQEEDDILREQIREHGTENWTIIASKFKDKTTRQCRRRWFTYLNSDFKKGGWSPEEDMLLCEAQKIFGNRWTEIAKVVSGRTDNAVKNRFTTLCKKRAKREALAKENSTTSYINLNNKRVLFRSGLDADGGSESAATFKRTRTYMSNTIENCNRRLGDVAYRLRRRPFQVLTEMQINDIKEASTNESVNNDNEQTFLRKDDPKILALMQQAELLSSLAVKVNTEKTDESLENAWAVLHDYLKQNKEHAMPTIRNSDTDFRLMEDLKSSNEGSRSSSWRDRDACDFSPASSEYSTESIMLSNASCEETDEHELQLDRLDDEQHSLAEENGILRSTSGNEVTNILAYDDMKGDNGALCGNPNTEFGSPIHVTPFFGALAAAIPSPKFSESEKHFLMKTLGMESTSSSEIVNLSQSPPCKRSLLHCL